MKAESVGAAAERAREARLCAALKVIEIARENDAIIFAGDMFEDNAIDRALVRQVGEILRSFEKPVFIILGNHDPLTPGSVWEHQVWEESENLQILRDAASIEWEDCVLFPCPLKEKYSQSNTMAWIDVRQENANICIGLAHGDVEGIPGEAPNHPIPCDAPSRCSLDYVALEHWHSYKIYTDEDGTERMAYSGAHETTKFGERDSGNVLLVGIAGCGSAPVIKPIKTGVLDWLTWDETIDQPGDLVALVSKLDEISDTNHLLLRIQLSGILFPDDQTHLNTIEEKFAAGNFLYSSLNTDSLLPDPYNDEWIEFLPAGVFQDTATKLQRDAAQSGGTEKQAIVKKALLLLFEINHKEK